MGKTEANSVSLVPAAPHVLLKVNVLSCVLVCKQMGCVAPNYRTASKVGVPMDDRDGQLFAIKHDFDSTSSKEGNCTSCVQLY